MAKGSQDVHSVRSASGGDTEASRKEISALRPSDEHWCGRPPLPPSRPRPPTPRLMWQPRRSRSGAGVDRRHPCAWCVDVWCWLLVGAGGVVSAFRRLVGVSSSGCSRVGLGRACALGTRATVALLRSSSGRGVSWAAAVAYRGTTGDQPKSCQYGTLCMAPSARVLSAGHRVENGLCVRAYASNS